MCILLCRALLEELANVGVLFSGENGGWSHTAAYRSVHVDSLGVLYKVVAHFLPRVAMFINFSDHPVRKFFFIPLS